MILVILLIILFLLFYGQKNEKFNNFKLKKENKFPFRYLCDENNQIIPVVLVSGFFRDTECIDMFNNYINNGIKMVGITAYKSFPNKITDDTPDKYIDIPFDYYSNIKNWLCCFNNTDNFDSRHNLYDMSESDFYDAEHDTSTPKKYDIIYSCLKDDDTCPENGWNAINRNFELAKKCFPVMINEYGLKVLVVGRTNCGLDYGNNMEIVDFLPYQQFQQKMRESKFLFVPNIYDASPRVVAEALIKDIPVLMNKNILCGSKYINDKTGELFTNEIDLRGALTKLINGGYTPKKEWEKNYSRKKSAIKLRNWLVSSYPELNYTSEIYFM
jgi:hypothetical protein